MSIASYLQNIFDMFYHLICFEKDYVKYIFKALYSCCVEEFSVLFRNKSDDYLKLSIERTLIRIKTKKNHPSLKNKKMVVQKERKSRFPNFINRRKF